MMNKLTKATIRILLILTSIVLLLWFLVSRPALFEYSHSTNQTYPDVTRVNQNALKQHVDKLAVELVPRSYRDIDNLNAAAMYIRSALNFDNSKTHLQSYRVGKETYHNVIAEFGSEGKPIIVGAHYDAYGDLPGADDNASGVAALLELARLLCQIEFKQRIILIAYTLEEPPMYNTQFMGSFVHAASLKQQNQEIEYMISLETIGYYSDEPGSQDYPLPLLHLFYPDEGNFIGVVGSISSNLPRKLRKAINLNTPLPAYSIHAPSAVTGVDFSDHRSYWQHGYDAVMVTDTAFFRNKAYHTPQDTPERLDYQKMAAVVAGVYAFITTDR